MRTSDTKREQDEGAGRAHGTLYHDEPFGTALAKRPSFSIRARIILAFLIAFLFTLATAIITIVSISQMNTMQTLHDSADEIVFEIEEARRYEKNFFLYGERSDLFESLSHINAAANLIAGNEEELRPALGAAKYNLLRANLKDYEDTLAGIASQYSARSAQPIDADSANRVRVYGHQALKIATNVIDQERAKTRAASHAFLLSAVFLVIVNLLVMIWVASELTRQILKPLGRAVGYTRQIAGGDFTPITPKRKYRDEFSDLAMAINSMIHALREKQEQLLQSRKMAAVGTLTSGIAHELNNPLNNISVTTEALLEETNQYTEKQKQKMLQDIFTQVERASATVRNLLDFTRADNFKVESIDVEQLINSSLRLISNEAAVNRVTSEVCIRDGLLRIRGDFGSLQQVFLNMFLNSIQAMSHGGTISIGVAGEVDGMLELTIADTGCGIPAEDLERIFEPFFTTKEVGVGTGLGLSVAYGIVQEIGGRIWVESEVGKGTTFHVLLPIDAPPTEDDGEENTADDRRSSQITSFPGGTKS